MNSKQLWVSAVTAFIIAAGGALGVVLVGDAPSLWQVLAAVVLGLVVAAKDIRSLLQLPPVGSDTPPTGKPPRLGLWIIGLIGLLGLTGCSTPQRPPSATEQKYFTVQTNFVPVVLLVTNRTEATETTPAVATVTPVTKLVEEYDFAPNDNAAAVATTGAAVGSIYSPVAGGVTGAAITGLFGLWALFRSKKRETSNEMTAGELAQIIQTGRQILLQLPEGAKYEAAWKDWMVKHQAETQTIAQVSQLVALAVDNDKAKGAAQSIVNLIQAQPK